MRCMNELLRSVGFASLLLAAAFAASSATSPLALAGQIDSGTYFRLQRGMSESELLSRAGPPDLVTSPGTVTTIRRSGAVAEPVPDVQVIDTAEKEVTQEVKQYHYIPGPYEPDPFLTVITIRGGQVWDIERTKLFTRPKYPADQPDDAGAGRTRKPSDEEILLQRAEDRFKAAKEYAETRTRLMREAGKTESTQGQPATSEKATIYRSSQPDGSFYFGDAPPPPEFAEPEAE